MAANRRLPWIAPLFLLSLAATAFMPGPPASAAPAAPESWLLRIDTTEETALARLADEGGRPVRVGPTYTLVLATAAEEQLPALQALRPVRLGPWRADMLYFVVYLQDAHADQAPLDALARVLSWDDHSAVVEVSPEGAARLNAEYPTARIFDRTLRYSAGLARGHQESRQLRAVQHDPDIQAIVDQVDQTRLQARVQDLQNFGTRISTGTGGVNAMNYLINQFTSLGYTDVTTYSYNSWSDDVIVVKPGLVTPEKIYVIGGHYDSIASGSSAPGADDNASGTVGVLEAARLLYSHDFESTIYFIAWSGEEQGLVGSDAWCTWAVSQGLDIRGYINLDMEGYLASGDAKDLDILSNTGSTWLHDLVFELVPLYVPTLSLVNGYLSSGSSDHASFWDHGYSALFFFEDSGSYSPYIHTANDVIGTSLNNFAFMKENVQAAIATVATLAEPFRIGIDHTPLADTPNTSEPYPVVARIIAVAPLVPDSLRVLYRTNGGAFSSLLLTATVNPDEYQAAIPAQSAGTVVEYYLRARDQAGHVGTDPGDAPATLHSFVVGLQAVLVDDFEADHGWTVGATGDNATTGIWLRADPVATDYQTENDHTLDPAHLCFVTGNGSVGGGNGDQDVDGGRTSLLSPVFDLQDAGYAKLTYWRWYVDVTSLDDDFWVYLSNNGGTSWTLLEQVTESAYPWEQAVFADLEQVLPLTSQMRLKFVAEDINTGSLVEAALDDFSLMAFFPAAGSVEEAWTAIGRTRLLPARPNPSLAGSRLAFELAAPGPADLSLYDVQGRTVWHLARSTWPAGIHSIPWDGIGEGGHALPAGLYLLRFRSGQQTWEQKVTLLR